MKKKHLILTKHAEERLLARNIKIEQVKRAVYDPEVILPAWGKKKRVMREFGEKTLDVIYRERENVIIIVTAVWLQPKERFIKNVKDR